MGRCSVVHRHTFTSVLHEAISVETVQSKDEHGSEMVPILPTGLGQVMTGSLFALTEQWEQVQPLWSGAGGCFRVHTTDFPIPTASYSCY
jgi:hypothetical protein